VITSTATTSFRSKAIITTAASRKCLYAHYQPHQFALMYTFTYRPLCNHMLGPKKPHKLWSCSYSSVFTNPCFLEDLRSDAGLFRQWLKHSDAFKFKALCYISDCITPQVVKRLAQVHPDHILLDALQEILDGDIERHRLGEARYRSPAMGFQGLA
jgi:hypothetical protein